MTRTERALRLLRVRLAERQAAAAERETIEAARRHRLGLVERLDALYGCYVAEAGGTTAAALSGGAFQRQRIDRIRVDTMLAVAGLVDAGAAAAAKCREADRQKRSAEKFAARADRSDAERRARLAENIPHRRNERR